MSVYHKKQSLKEIINEIENISKEKNILIVSTDFFSLEKQTIQISYEQILEIIKKFPPKILYLEKNLFESDLQVIISIRAHIGVDLEEDQEIELNNESDDQISNKLKEYLKTKTNILKEKWKHKNKTIFNLCIIVSVDNIFHRFEYEDNWIHEFYNEIDNIKEEYFSIRREYNSSIKNEYSLEIQRMAEILMKDERFFAPKATKSKRIILGESLFPDVDEREISEAVERATNLIWLKSVSQ